MKNAATLSSHLPLLRRGDARLVSYNIEMTEVTGGTFWKTYTPAQIRGEEPFLCGDLKDDFTAMRDLMQYYPPTDLSHPRLRALAKALSPAWVRVSGSWATKTYYDFDGKTGGKPPAGYASVLTREQWAGVLDFVKDTGSKLLISVSNCEGDHPNGGALDLTQTKKIFDFSRDYGVPIHGAEFMNEPNMLSFSGAPKGYTARDFVRDQDLFFRWVREHYPHCILVGPCTLGDGPVGRTGGIGAALGEGMGCTVHALMEGAEEQADVFSYHCYNGISERLASVFPQGHWGAEDALSEEYLSLAAENVKVYGKLRDRYLPEAPLWVTEAGDAGGGGNTWASTCLDVFRTLRELGDFAALTEGIVFHNTLASSDYGWLDREDFRPRPNYFAALLFHRLMGREVYNASLLWREGFRVYCHSRGDGKEGKAFLCINTSAQTKALELPASGRVFLLQADTLRAPILKLNGVPLALTEEGGIPDLSGKEVPPGEFLLPPQTCAFWLC